VVSCYQSFSTSTFRTILNLSAELFERVFKDYFHQFNKIGDKALPYPIVSTRLSNILNGFGCDGSTLEALFRKLSLEDAPKGSWLENLEVMILLPACL